MTTQTLDRILIMDAVHVAEEAAIAAWALVGHGDEKAADQAAVDAHEDRPQSIGHRRA